MVLRYTRLTFFCVGVENCAFPCPAVGWGYVDILWDDNGIADARDRLCASRGAVAIDHQPTIALQNKRALQPFR